MNNYIKIGLNIDNNEEYEFLRLPILEFSFYEKLYNHLLKKEFSFLEK